MSLIKSSVQSVTAYAPATCANVAVGFDILGFACDVVGDRVTLTRHTTDDNTLTIQTIQGVPDGTLPLDPEKNTAAVVLQQLKADLNLTAGFDIELHKGIPLSSGLGGSAASACAALVALNAFLTEPLTPLQLAHYALAGEAVAAGGRHADNIVPCLLGGMTLTRKIDPIEVIQLPIPELYCVIVHPHFQLDTRLARQVLPNELPLKLYIQQSANLASFIAALYQNNNDLLQDSLHDVLIEPYRKSLIAGFAEVKQAALQHGAIGASISGAGPSVFAFAKQNKDEAERIGLAMQNAFKEHGNTTTMWVAPISPQGARVVEPQRL